MKKIMFNDRFLLTQAVLDGRKTQTRRFPSPRYAYASLIDKISGKGTWDSNPYVFAYDFELLT